MSQPNAIVVFTGKSLSHIREAGGSSSWVLDQANAKRCRYLVCCRSGVDWVEGPEPRGSAFLVGLISDVVRSRENPDRYLIKISEYAEVNVPGVWKGWRNPVRYMALDELGIDAAALDFQPMPEPLRDNTSAEVSEDLLTIPEAKRRLAKSLGVSEASVEITIRA